MSENPYEAPASSRIPPKIVENFDEVRFTEEQLSQYSRLVIKRQKRISLSKSVAFAVSAIVGVTLIRDGVNFPGMLLPDGRPGPFFGFMLLGEALMIYSVYQFTNKILSYAPGLRTKSLNSLAVRIGTIVEAEDQDES